MYIQDGPRGKNNWRLRVKAAVRLVMMIIISVIIIVDRVPKSWPISHKQKK